MVLAIAVAVVFQDAFVDRLVGGVRVWRTAAHFLDTAFAPHDARERTLRSVVCRSCYEVVVSVSATLAFRG